MIGGGRLRFFCKCLMTSALCLVVASASGQMSSRERAARFKASHAFVSPLHLPPLLSGNFGELRGNHFHTGIDWKTEGREGFPVLAATDGVVSRVKMSPWGYGNALYLEGPDGVTTVYAHLQSFAEDVQAWAVARTYARRTLGLDAKPLASDSLSFHAGDTLGWSGNSGGSGGPHLHFEIRDTGTQRPLNPLDGWVDKPDTRRPVIGQLWVEGEGALAGFPRGADSIAVPGVFRLGVEAYDLLDGASNVCGIRTMQATLRHETTGHVLVDHRFEIDVLDFSVNKHMNAHALYPVWQSQRDQVHRLHHVPSNRLPIYDTPSGSGWVRLEAGESADLVVEVTDAAGNASQATWRLVGGLTDLQGWQPRPAASCPSLVESTPDAGGNWSSDSPYVPRVSWEAGTWFEPSRAGWEKDPRSLAGTLHPIDEPYLKPVSLSWSTWDAGKALPGSWHTMPAGLVEDSKWVLCQRDDEGNVERTVLATVEEGRVVGKVRHGGPWAMDRDTLPPKLIPYHSGTPLVPNGDAVWFVEDALSGVEEVSLRVDGRWARLVWDPKRSMLTYKASDGIHPVGKPCLVEVEAKDACGNKATWSSTLVWP